jgi:hypothetical protein
MTPDPKYKPLTEAQFRSQWKTYLKGNPDVAVEYGNDVGSAWRHYQEQGIADIQSGARKFSSITPTLFNQSALMHPEAFGLIDPKTGKHTAEFLKRFPEQARQYIVDNFTTKYDSNKNDFTASDLKVLTGAKLSEDQIRSVLGNYGIGSIATSIANKYVPDQRTAAISPESYRQFFDTGAKATPGQTLTGKAGVFDAGDLKFLQSQKFTNDQIAAIARSYGVDNIDPNLLKYDAKKKTYAAPELSAIAGDIFANYGQYEVGTKGIFDQADANLLRSLGYTDADIVSRARTLFGEDRLAPEVIQQYFPDLALRKPGSLFIEEPIQFDRTPQTVRPETRSGRGCRILSTVY